jgi:hypothetical protein
MALIWVGSMPAGRLGGVWPLVVLLLEPPQPAMETATVISRAAVARVERLGFMGSPVVLIGQ